ncbi:nucleotide pyrophosphohydrolase [Dactylosporangium sp. CA-233914]|uniref:nucleotide pyrophosphohydrolase n=1 Tax=Dactylosporangium sp. CA-233914 TaxID=3239934 RepID=UPI003D907446
MTTPSVDEWPARVQRELRHFAQERDWPQYHTPRNLLLALVGEVGELAELYQWDPPEPPPAARIAEEVADVMIYLLRFADTAGVDVATAVADKMAFNATRFPTLTDQAERSER